MGEDDIVKFLSRGSSKPAQPGFRAVPRARPVAGNRSAAGMGGPGVGRASHGRQQGPAQFKDFSATHLLCPKCRQANPVRQRLLLVLPDGDLYEYLCSVCNTSLGKRKA